MPAAGAQSRDLDRRARPIRPAGAAHHLFVRATTTRDWSVIRCHSCAARSRPSGAREIWDETDDTCHLNGTARMGDDPQTSVVNADCRSWDIPNLWICDGSVFPTVGGVNPSLTIQAIACRTADRIKTMAARGEL